jgi:hypothetical protein
MLDGGGEEKPHQIDGSAVSLSYFYEIIISISLFSPYLSRWGFYIKRIPMGEPLGNIRI